MRVSERPSAKSEQSEHARASLTFETWKARKRMETHERFLGARAFCKRITIRPFLPAQLPNSHFGRQGKNEKDKWGGMRGLFQACARADGVLYRNKSTRVVKNRRRRQRAPARSLARSLLALYLTILLSGCSSQPR